MIDWLTGNSKLYTLYNMKLPWEIIKHLTTRLIKVFVEFVKDKRGKVFNISLYRLFLRLKSWEVGTLLIRVEVLGNESSENRNGYAPFWSKR